MSAKDVHRVFHQLSELQETVKRLCNTREAEMEIDKWFQNHTLVAGDTENVISLTLITHKSLTLLHSPPCSIAIKTRYEALTAVDTFEQGL